jgi:hypothetical protein
MLILEEVGDLAYKSAECVGGRLGEEGEECVDELLRGDGASVIRGDV